MLSTGRKIDRGCLDEGHCKPIAPWIEILFLEEVDEFVGSTHIGSMGSLVKSSLSLNKRPSVAHTGTLGLIKEEDSLTESDEKTIKDIFRFPIFSKALVIIFFAFFVIAMVFMGISYNAAELPGTIWANNAINGLLDCIAQFISKSSESRKNSYYFQSSL